MKKDLTVARPWKVRLGINESFIDGKDIVCLAVVNYLMDTNEAKANAKLIVKAVNNFDALLEACKEAKEVLLKVYKDDKGVDIFHALGLLDNAIKQGEGK